MAPLLSVQNVRREFDVRGKNVLALDTLNLALDEGEFVTVVGPSGCGKSTLLNLVVGLLPPSAGEILFRGRAVNGINPEIGYVTQKDNLLPWRTLIENVELALEIRGTAKDERRRRAEKLIAQVGLTGFEEHYPHELSGGMRQRAALARALAARPEVLLGDEPFGALDAQSREVLQQELQQVWSEAGNTFVFVTHNVREAVFLADRVIVMSARPGTLLAEYRITAPRPRTFEDVLLTKVVVDVHDNLAREVERAALDTEGDEPDLA